MAFNTGLFWLHNDGLATSTAYTTTGTVKTKAALDADIAADKIAVIETGGARAILIKPLLKTTGNGDGTDKGVFAVFGVMGFGEPSQSDYDEKSKFLWALGTIDVSDSASGSAIDTAGDIFTSPTNVEFKSYAGAGTGADQKNSVFSGVSGMQTPANAVDVADVFVEDRGADGIGMAIIPGIEMFSQIIISFNEGNLLDGSLANALINLHY